MNINGSQLLSRIGLDNFDLGYLFFAVIILFVVVFILFIITCVQLNKIKKLNERIKKFTLGKDGKSLEKDIISLYEDNKILKDLTDRNKSDIIDIYKRLEGTFQKMGLVKYDAFNQMGGQLSFSLALLDENNNGFIINSVHSTEGCYSYTKQIKNGVSELSLGKEEEEALEIAVNKK